MIERAGDAAWKEFMFFVALGGGGRGLKRNLTAFVQQDWTLIGGQGSSWVKDYKFAALLGGPGTCNQAITVVINHL